MNNKRHEKTLAALASYLDRGWSVFPCNQQKRPKISGGFKSATNDINKIVEWWSNSPGALIGVPTGANSTFWVLDIDIKDGRDGKQSLSDYMNKLGTTDLPNTLRQRTASGGYQLLFKWNDERPVRNGTELLFRGSGLDVRGEGGYIIVPPSARLLNDVWVEYTWQDQDEEIADAPDWLYDLVTNPPAADSSSSKSSHQRINLEQLYRETIPKGTRDDTLFRIACKLRSLDVPHEVAMFVVQRFGERCEPYDAEVRELVTEKVDGVYDRYTPSNKNEKLKNLIKKKLSEGNNP